MRIIDADKFLTWLIFSKHIDGLTCGEVKEAIEMCKVDILDKIRAEIGKSKTKHELQIAEKDIKAKLLISDIYCDIVNILNEYKAESEEV